MSKGEDGSKGKELEGIHWIDKIVSGLEKKKEEIVLEAGLSPSGILHIGNLRGEVIIPSVIKNLLKGEGKNVKQYIIFYTQDPFKAKESQLKQFESEEEANEYKGRKLVDVPDPEGCHSSWAQHFQEEFTSSFEDFGIDVEVLSTTDFYSMPEAKAVIREIFENREEIREVINNYRERNPFPEDWIPFNPYCENCGRVDSTKALDYDLDEWTVDYECKECSDTGTSSMEKGKLNWRVEWSTLWEVLDVDFEPYGKDHMTPGGSRESCMNISKEMGWKTPGGFGYEWVYWKREGDVKGGMTSSGFMGITPNELLKFCSPGVYRYKMISTRPTAEIYFDPAEINLDYQEFDKAERVYFGNEEVDNEKDKRNFVRNYELSMIREIPDEQPFQLSFNFAAQLSQIYTGDDRFEKIIEVLRENGHVEGKLTDFERERIRSRIEKAEEWVNDWREDKKFEIVEDPDVEVSEGEKEVVREFINLLDEELTSDELEEKIFDLAKDTVGSKNFFQLFYKILLDQDHGPRLAPFVISIGRDRVKRILKKTL